MSVAEEQVVKYPDDLRAAVDLWASLSGRKADLARVQVLKESKGTRVYRLPDVGPGGEAVIAKRRRAVDMTTELLWYRELAPHVGVRSAQFYGHVPDRSHPWLMLEDVGDEPYNGRRREHRAALTRWLLAVHRDTASVSATAQLPRHGTGRYRDHLRATRRLIDENLGNPVLARDDIVFLADVWRLLAELDAGWADIEAICAGCPPTLVHGDLAGKNIRIHSGDGGTQAVVLDWTTAGWGIPAPDLSVSPRASISPRPLLGLYGRSPDRIGGLSSGRLRRLSVVGTSFRALAAMHWSAMYLTTPHVSRQLGRLAFFQEALVQSLTRLRLRPGRGGA